MACHHEAMSNPYTVTRAIRINASAERVHDMINDFRQWEGWSPWEGLDPDMDRSYLGPEAGVGAGYAWSGNRKAGKGSMRITADQPRQIDLELHFDRPFPADNQLVFVLTDESGSTAVEWRMHGQLNTLMALISRIKSMDSMVGPDFERGLRQLKALAESRPADS